MHSTIGQEIYQELLTFNYIKHWTKRMQLNKDNVLVRMYLYKKRDIYTYKYSNNYFDECINNTGNFLFYHLRTILIWNKKEHEQRHLYYWACRSSRYTFKQLLNVSPLSQSLITSGRAFQKVTDLKKYDLCLLDLLHKGVLKLPFNLWRVG